MQCVFDLVVVICQIGGEEFENCQIVLVKMIFGNCEVRFGLEIGIGD